MVFAPRQDTAGSVSFVGLARFCECCLSSLLRTSNVGVFACRDLGLLRGHHRHCAVKNHVTELRLCVPVVLELLHLTCACFWMQYASVLDAMGS